MNIWSMNKKYVELHNANADLYGFTTGMNEFADLVSGVLTLIENPHLSGVLTLI